MRAYRCKYLETRFKAVFKPVGAFLLVPKHFIYRSLKKLDMGCLWSPFLNGSVFLFRSLGKFRKVFHSAQKFIKKYCIILCANNYKALIYYKNSKNNFFPIFY